MYKHFLNALDVFENTGSTDQVYDIVERIDDQVARESTFTRVAKSLARRGLTDEAWRFASAVHDEKRHIHCLREIARQFRRKGDFASGAPFLQKAYLKATNLQASAWETANLFLGLSSELHEFGLVSEAETIFRRAMELAVANSVVGNSKFLCFCSMQLAKWGRGEEAKALAHTIKDEWFRRHALTNLSRGEKHPD